MAKKGFDLAALARASMGENMSYSDIETVEMIPANRIRTNEANFYEMSELEELAASIELVGLLHPVIVRLDEGGDGFVLVDGERRFRAMTEVLGRTEIPCIRRSPVNDVIEELMLIEANRQQRKMTAGELSRQAERYTELLAKLRDAGVPIPGRLRKAVAEAMQVSESKLARLSAIRKNLILDLLELFDAGKLNESAAYEYSKLSAERQATVAGDDPNKFASDIPALAAQAEKCFDFRACPYGGACSHGNRMFERCLKMPRWAWCLSSKNQSCCKTCAMRFSCEYVCGRAAADVEKERQDNADARERREAEAKERRAVAEIEGRAREKRNRERADRAWAFFRQRREELGIRQDDARLKKIFGYGFDDDCKSYEARDDEEIDITESPVDLLATGDIIDLMTLLECSAEELMGVPAVSESDTGAGLVWHDAGAGDLPDADVDAARMIAWGNAGVKSVPGSSGDSFRRAHEHWPEDYRWWAVVEGPDLSGCIED